jgi:hypothetical protein
VPKKWRGSMSCRSRGNKIIGKNVQEGLMEKWAQTGVVENGSLLWEERHKEDRSR